MAVAEIESSGFWFQRKMFSLAVVDHLLSGLEQAKNTVHERAVAGQQYALRNILNIIPEVLELAQGEPIMAQVKSVLGNSCRPVKATLFDKTAEVNWNLRWHQDNVIAVDRKIELDGFHGWTEKTGIPHVRPPDLILMQMLAARIHLDDCAADNGALMVLPGSHVGGRLNDEQVQNWIGTTEPVICAASKGDVLFMRPLLLHCSRRSEKPNHRRILHIEYAGCDLPGGLEWGSD